MEKIEENTVYVGDKPNSVYAFSVQTIFDKGIDKVKLKTRGKFILKAISIVEYMKRNNQLEIEEIKISSEPFKRKEDNKEIFVSSIEINVKKK